MGNAPILGLDYGERRIGIAVSDSGQRFAFPLKVLENTGTEPVCQAISKLVLQHRAGAVVVGLPVREDGSFGPEAEKVALFAKQLERFLSVPVFLYDERYTTRIARRLRDESIPSQRRGANLDAAAAAVMLEGFLQWKSNTAKREQGRTEEDAPMECDGSDFADC